MKILITGAKGLLGGYLVDFFKNSYRVFAFGRKDLDITDFKSLKNKIAEIKPDILINCAAYTDVDGAEKNFKEAFRVNGFGVRNLAILSRDYDFHLIHFSTNYVFKGDKNRLYNEFDIVSPVNTYGESKLAGELEIEKFSNNYSIIRISWLYGNGGNSFPVKILKKAEKERFINVVNDIYCSPTSVRMVAETVNFVIRNGIKGILHCSCEGFCTLYEYALILKDIFKFPSKILPISSKKFSFVARRPNFSVLESIVFRDYGYTFRNFREELISFYRDYGKV